MFSRAFSNFRPEISGYYQKGKVDTSSKGFNITSDGIITETNKGVVISQSIFDGGSSFSEIQISKNEIFSQRFYLKSVEQEVFLESRAKQAAEKARAKSLAKQKAKEEKEMMKNMSKEDLASLKLAKKLQKMELQAH